MKVAEFAKRLARRPYDMEAGEFAHGHNSLNAIARRHAAHSVTMRTGTPFDWEDLERYQEELARLDREGPGKPKTKRHERLN